ncbi:MAG TPA: hypothetical protein VE224_08635 [Pseudolabrys sp.]|nr:hypothetical protein [Pseudolabrys sp.]
MSAAEMSGLRAANTALTIAKIVGASSRSNSSRTMRRRRARLSAIAASKFVGIDVLLACPAPLHCRPSLLAGNFWRVVNRTVDAAARNVFHAGMGRHFTKLQ